MIRQVEEQRHRPGPGATPGGTAYLTVQHDRHSAQSVKGDHPPRHHRLVSEYLDGLPPGTMVRGGDRHAELVVVSTVLHAYDRRRATAGQPPLTGELVRDLLSTARLEVFRDREPDDIFGGPAERPCDSCVTALVHFGVLPWSHLAFTEEWRPGPQPVPEPGRFPPDVAHTLVAGGWRADSGGRSEVLETIAAVCALPGRFHQHDAFPAAEWTLTAFPGLVCGRRGVGEQVWIRRFEISPIAVARSADSLARLAATLGARLFPIGTESGDSILAVDELGRIFALDQAGDWFVGGDIDNALTNLLLGRAPARIRDDGTW